MIKVNIAQEIFIQRTQERRHIGFPPSRLLQQNHSPANGATGEVLQIECGKNLALVLCKKAL